MADRNPNDLNREQRGSMTPSPTERVEDRNTRSREDELSNPNRSNTPNRDSAVGDEHRDHLGTDRRSSIEGDESSNR